MGDVHPHPSADHPMDAVARPDPVRLDNAIEGFARDAESAVAELWALPYTTSTQRHQWLRRAEDFVALTAASTGALSDRFPCWYAATDHRDDTALVGHKIRWIRRIALRRAWRLARTLLSDDGSSDGDAAVCSRFSADLTRLVKRAGRNAAGKRTLRCTADRFVTEAAAAAATAGQSRRRTLQIATELGRSLFEDLRIFRVLRPRRTIGGG